MVLLAACVAAIAATGVRFPGYGLPGWLDATFDPRFQAQQGRFPALLDWLPHLGQLKAVTAMTVALLLACAITRRWRGAVLTALAVPLAIGMTDYVIKPTIGEAIGAAFPSGHATSSFVLAASFAVLLANPPFRMPAGRYLVRNLQYAVLAHLRGRNRWRAVFRRAPVEAALAASQLALLRALDLEAADGVTTVFSHTDTWAVLSPVKVERSHPAQRLRSVIPASFAIRSSSLRPC